MAKVTTTSVNRRSFLKGAAVGAAAIAVPKTGMAQTAEARRTTATPMMPAEADPDIPSAAEVLTTDRPGSDFMVDVIKSLNLEYICSNPGSSFRSLQESLVNYGGNKNPEFITCCHEESAAGMAHGYSKVEGK